jgi:hypothetical protein
VKPLPCNDLREIAASLYPNLPASVVDSSMMIFQLLDHCGRIDTTFVEPRGSGEEFDTMRVKKQWTGGRTPSVRDLFKLLARVSNGICFEKGSSFTTEAQQTLCMAESGAGRRGLLHTISIGVFVGDHCRSCAEIRYL